MIGLFKQKNPANIAALLVLGLFIKLPLFFNVKEAITSAGDGILYTWLVAFLKPVAQQNGIIFPFFSFLLLFTQAVMLNRFINSQRMMNRANFLPGLAYMLLTSLQPQWNYFSAPLIVNTFILYIFFILFNSYGKNQARGAVFNMGLALGVASLFFTPAAALIIWVMLGLAIIRPFRLNEWLIALLGLTTPYYFYGLYLFLANQWNWQSLLPALKPGLPMVKQTGWLATALTLITIPLLSGGFLVQNNLGRMLIQVRKEWSLFLLYLLLTIILPFFSGGPGMEIWVLALLPIATFHAATYQYSKSRLYLMLVFWLTVAFIFIYQYKGPGW